MRANRFSGFAVSDDPEFHSGIQAIRRLGSLTLPGRAFVSSHTICFTNNLLSDKISTTKSRNENSNSRRLAATITTKKSPNAIQATNSAVLACTSYPVTGAESFTQIVLNLGKGRSLGMAQPQETSSLGKTGSPCDAGMDPRFEAPATLLRHGISCAVWAEDALWHYGARTVCFDLFLLVENPEEAAQCLESAGYSRALPNSRYRFIPELYVLPRFRKGPLDDVEDIRATYIAFLRAKQCRYSLPPASTLKELVPPLPALIDSIIDAWLDATTTDYAIHLQTHLAYLCAAASPRARDPLFINELKPEHRDFYLRSLSHTGIGAEREKWRRVRDSFLLMA